MSISRKIAAAVLAVCSALPCSGQRLALPWQEASRMVDGRGIVAELATSSIRGRVVRIDADAMTIRTATGEQTVQSAEIARIRFRRVNERAMRTGWRAGFIGGMVAGLIGATAIGLDETHADTKAVRNAKAGVALGGLWGAGIAAGALLGRALGREEVVIDLIHRPKP